MDFFERRRRARQRRARVTSFRLWTIRAAPIGVAHYSSTFANLPAPALAAHAGDRSRVLRATHRRSASDYRRQVVRDTDAYRVVHAEGDRLPALIVDRYGDYLVVQTLDQGMDRAKDWIVSALVELFAPRGIVARNDAGRARARRSCRSRPAWSSAKRRRVDRPHERSGIPGRSVARPEDRHLPRSARELRGRRAIRTRQSARLLHLHRRLRAAPGGQVRIGGGGGRARPRRWPPRKRTAQPTRIANVEFREANVFDMLAGYTSARREFSTVVLDPPAFAKSRRNLEGAARGLQGDQPARPAPARAGRRFW